MAYASLWSSSESLHSYFESDIIDLGRWESTVAFLQAVWPYIIPPLFVIGVEAPLSLRTWIAVQNAPLGQNNKEVCQKSFTSRISRFFSFSRKYALTHIAPAYLLIVTLLGAGLQCLGGVEPETMILYDAITLAPLFTYVTTRLIAFCLNIYALSVKRDEEGDPYIVRTLRPQLPRVVVLLPILLSVGIVFRSVMYNEDKLCTSIIHAALLLDLVGSDIATSKTFRSMAMYAITNVLTLVALTAFLSSHAGNLSLLHFSIGPFFGDSQNFDTDYSNYHATHSSHYAAHPLTTHFLNLLPGWLSSFVETRAEMGYADVDRWPLFALSVLWNVFPVELIALCYRFDYSRALIRLREQAVDEVEFAAARDEILRNQSCSRGWGLRRLFGRQRSELGLGLGLGLEVRGEEGTREEKVPLITHDFLSATSWGRTDISDGRGPVCLPTSPITATTNDAMTSEECGVSHHRLTSASGIEQEGTHVYKCPNAPPPSPCCGTQVADDAGVDNINEMNTIGATQGEQNQEDETGDIEVESKLPSYSSLRWFIFSRPSKTRPLSACAALTYTISTITFLWAIFFLGPSSGNQAGSYDVDVDSEGAGIREKGMIMIWTAMKVQYVAPLLPLVTLPIIVLVVLLRATSLSAQSSYYSRVRSCSGARGRMQGILGAVVGGLWRYEEMWGGAVDFSTYSRVKVIQLPSTLDGTSSVDVTHDYERGAGGVVYCVFLNEDELLEEDRCGRKVFVDEKILSVVA